MDPAHDLATLFFAQEKTRRYRAEREAASAHLEMALLKERMAELMSAHDPVAALGLDRERLRIALRFLAHGDTGRAFRDLEALTEQS